jgi:hypothetical protein
VCPTAMLTGSMPHCACVTLCDKNRNLHSRFVSGAVETCAHRTVPNAHACPVKLYKRNLKLLSLHQELLKRVSMGPSLMRMRAPFSYEKRNSKLSSLHQELLKRVPIKVQ